MKKLLSAIGLFALLFACGGGEEVDVVVDDILQAAPDSAAVLFDNDHLTITKFTVAPQVELPLHQGRSRLVYSLSDYRLQFRQPEYPPDLRMFQKGTAHWHGSGVHGVKNVGATTAEYLVVTSKIPNPTPGVTSNIAELTPNQARVVFEHQNAKVIEISLQPGDKQPAHVAASRAIYSLTDAKLSYTAGEEKSETETKAGDIHYHAGGEHTVENLSETPVQYVVFEMM